MIKEREPTVHVHDLATYTCWEYMENVKKDILTCKHLAQQGFADQNTQQQFVTFFLED